MCVSKKRQGSFCLIETVFRHPKCCFDRIVLKSVKTSLLSDPNHVSHFSSPEFNFSDQDYQTFKNVGYNLDIMSGCKSNHGL